MEWIYNFETNQFVIITDFLKKLVNTEKLHEEKIKKLINSINKHNLEILHKINNLVINSFDFKTHLNSLLNFIKTLDIINLNYNDDEVVLIINLIERDLETYWKNLTFKS